MTLFLEATAAMAKITIVIQMPQHCITHTTVRISFGSKIDCLSLVPGFSLLKLFGVCQIVELMNVAQYLFIFKQLSLHSVGCLSFVL